MSRRHSSGARDAFGLLAGVVVVLAACVPLQFVCASMASDERAVRAVENIGLRDVRVLDKGPAWGVLGGCHSSDVAKITVTGLDAQNVSRTVEVCAPVPFGGYTIRN